MVRLLLLTLTIISLPVPVRSPVGQVSLARSDDHQESKSSTSTSQGDDLTPEQRQEKKVYYVAREIMSSEKVFVDVLRLLNIEFREYVERKMQESRVEILPDEDFARMFSNLPELLIFN